MSGFLTVWTADFNPLNALTIIEQEATPSSNSVGKFVKWQQESAPCMAFVHSWSCVIEAKAIVFEKARRGHCRTHWSKKWITGSGARTQEYRADRSPTLRSLAMRRQAVGRPHAAHSPLNGTIRTSCFQVIIPMGSGPAFKLSRLVPPSTTPHHQNTSVSKQLHL